MGWRGARRSSTARWRPSPSPAGPDEGARALRQVAAAQVAGARTVPAAEPWAKKQGFTVPVGGLDRAARRRPRAQDRRRRGGARVCDAEAVRAVFADEAQAKNRWPLLFFAVWSLIHLEGAAPRRGAGFAALGGRLPLGPEFLLLRPRVLDGLVLDEAVAADRLRDGGDLDGDRQALVGEAGEQPLDGRPRSRLISSRSILRSAVQPKGSSGVPRRNFSLASVGKPPFSIQPPKAIFRPAVPALRRQHRRATARPWPCRP